MARINKSPKVSFRETDLTSVFRKLFFGNGRKTTSYNSDTFISGDSTVSSGEVSEPTTTTTTTEEQTTTTTTIIEETTTTTTTVAPTTTTTTTLSPTTTTTTTIDDGLTHFFMSEPVLTEQELCDMSFNLQVKHISPGGNNWNMDSVKNMDGSNYYLPTDNEDYWVVIARADLSPELYNEPVSSVDNAPVSPWVYINKVRLRNYSTIGAKGQGAYGWLGSDCPTTTTTTTSEPTTTTTTVVYPYELTSEYDTISKAEGLKLILNTTGITDGTTVDVTIDEGVSQFTGQSISTTVQFTVSNNTAVIDHTFDFGTYLFGNGTVTSTLSSTDSNGDLTGSPVKIVNVVSTNTPSHVGAITTSDLSTQYNLVNQGYDSLDINTIWCNVVALQNGLGLQNETVRSTGEFNIGDILYEFNNPSQRLSNYSGISLTPGTNIFDVTNYNYFVTDSHGVIVSISSLVNCSSLPTTTTTTTLSPTTTTTTTEEPTNTTESMNYDFGFFKVGDHLVTTVDGHWIPTLTPITGDTYNVYPEGEVKLSLDMTNDLLSATNLSVSYNFSPYSNNAFTIYEYNSHTDYRVRIVFDSRHQTSQIIEDVLTTTVSYEDSNGNQNNITKNLNIWSDLFNPSHNKY